MMTKTPVPPAAVQIVADVLARNAASVYEMDQEIVAALARAGWLHDPASYSEQSRAEVIALISRQAKRIAELEKWVTDRDERIACLEDQVGELEETS